MREPYARLSRLLVGYYAMIQLVHAAALAWTAAGLWRTGTITFLAPPPPGGWTAQALHFLIGTGIIDGLNVGLSLIFVRGYLTRARWWSWVGAVALANSCYSAGIFAYGTIAAGAWGQHPVSYGTLAVLFLPIGLLALAFARWVVKGGAPAGPRTR